MEDDKDNFSEEEVYKILVESLKKSKEGRQYPNKVQLKKALISIMGEFLTCYKVIGFDYDGNLIDISCHQTQKDISALNTAFIDAFAEHMNRKMSNR